MAIIKIRNAAIDLDAAEIPNLPATKITSGTFDNARISLDAAEIPNLDTAKITTGTLADARVPDLNASKITAGTLADARVPNLNASKITAGTLADARVPDLNASKITAGTIATARLGSGTANSSTFLRGDNTFAEAGGGSMVLIKTFTASNGSNVTFDNGSNGVIFNNTYKSYFLNAQRVYGATNDQKVFAYIRVNGSNSSQAFRNVITYNTYNGQYTTDPGTAPNNDKLYQNAGTIRNTYPDGYFNGQFYFYGIGENTRMAMTGQATYKNNAAYQHNEAFCSGSDGTETTNGIRFQMGSGNIYGTFSLYGLVT